MNYMKIIILYFIAFLSIAHPVFAGHKAKINADPFIKDYYEWITEMTAGPINYVYKSDSHEGGFIRFVVTTSEIYDSIIFEELIVGSEGCCKRVKETRALDFRKFWQEFGFIGEQGGVKFHKWLSPNSAEFYLHERKFKITDMDKKEVVIQEIETRKKSITN